MNFEHLTPVMGTITDITAYNDDCCSQFVSLSVDGQQIHIIMTHDTFVVDTMRLFPGMRIAAFYDSTQPVPLIYPPQYRADLIAVLRPEEDVAIGYFDENLTAIDNSLKLNLYQSTVISTMNGQAYLCSPANHYLLVYYTATTRSIPPQTAPGGRTCCARPLKVYMDGILPALMAMLHLAGNYSDHIACYAICPIAVSWPRKHLR